MITSRGSTILRRASGIALGALLLALVPTVPATAATITVNTLDDEFDEDPSECSVREAIQAANTDSAFGGCTTGSGPDLINLPFGTFQLTRQGSDEDQNATGDLDIHGDVTIDGDGSSSTVINALGFDRALHVHSGTVLVQDLKVQNGMAVSGGGIFNQANLTLQNVAVTDNVAGPAVEFETSGGGITNFGSLTVTNSAISGNSVVDGTFNGGGIHNQGQVTIDNTTISGNTAFDGGGIATIFGASLTITNSTLSSNTATGGGGGAITTWDGAFTDLNAVTVSGNSADGGGGLHVEGTGTLNITDSAIDTNGANHGGGLIADGGNVALTNTTVSGNTADFSGGAIQNQGGNVSIEGGTINGNDAGGEGGGIFNGDGDLGMNDVAVSDNTATTGGGGGLASFGGYVEIGQNSVFSGNTAAQGGGAIAVDGDLLMTGGALTNNSAATAGCCGGGGISVGGLANVTLQQVTINNNSSLGNDAGGGIFIFGDLVLQDTIVTGNTVPGDGQAGGIHVDPGGSLVMTSGEVTLNTASQGGGISVEGPCDECGQPAPGVATLEGTSVSSNAALNGGGGGISLGEGSHVTLKQGTTISDNTATFGGGGINNGGGTLVMTGGPGVDPVSVTANSAEEGGGVTNGGTADIAGADISGNTATFGGGGVTNYGTMTLTGSTVSGNGAEHGGGIWNDGTLTVASSTLVGGNTASSFGGGIANQGSGTLTVTFSEVSGNSAAESGGVGNWGAVTIRESTVKDNDADTAGGLGNQESMNLVRSTVSGNSATEGGGGIRNFDSLTVTNSTISGNSAEGFGGGIHNQAGAVATFNSSTFSDNSTVTGGGATNNDGALVLKNTILANSTGGPDCDHPVISQGHNLIESLGPNCTFSGDTTGNITGQDPLLGPLQYNGGPPTFTHDLLDGSPAIDAGSPDCPPPETDQRGFNRPIGPACDIGAVESESAPADGVTISINDVEVAEGTGGKKRATLTVTLSEPSADPVAVDFATSDGSATAPADYQSRSGSVGFSPGVTTRQIHVPIATDALEEPDEDFFVNLSNPVNATIADGQGKVTILDDDATAGTPTISVDDVTENEGTGTRTNFVFTVSLSQPSAGQVTVQWSTVDGTATASSGDYRNVGPSTITFNPGETSKTVTVAVRGDSLAEGDETFFVNLSNPTNATIADGQGVGTILDDD
ncbi:MAG TPA: Calx-beta domain-containing protein [Actinomycetota bacterium]|nr:Calx-beta domain-containing protein [Actinomycetota bacterium]